MINIGDARISYFSRWWVWLVLLLVVVTGGCQRGENPGRDTASSNSSLQNTMSSRVTSQIRLSEVVRSGVEFTYQNGEDSGNYAILESLGGGVGLADFDGDHVVDVFLPGGGGYSRENQIFGNASGVFQGQGDCLFRPATQNCRIGVNRHYSHGANIGDFDNDGFADVLVTGYGGLTLWRNQGDGTFTDATMSAGLDDSLWSSSSAWGDLDRDGCLDLYVAHYVDWSWEKNPQCSGSSAGQRDVCPPRRFEPLPDIAYLSNGDGTFRDGTSDLGLRKDGKGLGVVIADVDLDGDADVYVGNDTVPNFLYRNSSGRLEDAGLMSGTALSDRGTPDGSMGVDVGDITGDGLPDIWVANFESESFALYRNQGNGFFQHTSQSMGVTAVGALYVGWGTLLLDIDRDGDLDAFCSNGHVIRHPVNAPIKQHPLVFENLEFRRFVDVAPSAGDYTATAHNGRGCASGDLDRDGRVDLVVSRLNEPVAVLRNETDTKNGWLSLRLVGTQSNRDAVAAVVYATLSNGRKIVTQVKSGSSYASTSDKQIILGLGDGELEELSIQWPSGARSSHIRPRRNAELTIVEGDLGS